MMCMITLIMMVFLSFGPSITFYSHTIHTLLVHEVRDAVSVGRIAGVCRSRVVVGSLWRAL